MKNIIIIAITIIVLGVLAYMFNLLPIKKTADLQVEQKVLDPQRIGQEINSGQAILFDVRTSLELSEEGYAVGATHFDVARLQEGELPEVDKNIKVYLYCRSGRRAENAKNILKENGYINVVNIGGLVDWIKANGEIIKNYDANDAEQKNDINILLDDKTTGEIKFTGTVSPGGQDTCPVDGICSIMVSNMEVIWAQGWPQEPVGTMTEKIDIGDMVEVYGKRTNNNSTTLYGSKNYYIKNLSN